MAVLRAAGKLWRLKSFIQMNITAAGPLALTRLIFELIRLLIFMSIKMLIMSIAGGRKHRGQGGAII
jgi:hypothetical protein